MKLFFIDQDNVENAIKEGVISTELAERVRKTVSLFVPKSGVVYDTSTKEIEVFPPPDYGSAVVVH